MDGNTYERVKEDYDKLKDNVVAEKKMYKFVKRTVDIIASIFGIGSMSSFWTLFLRIFLLFC